jgi:hypothetical protein
MQGDMINLSEKERILIMKHSGGLVKHLGLQMYSTSTSAISELIANAWDAEANKVEIQIPLGVPFKKDSFISVYDDGTGMTFDDCNDKYLVVGRNRREKEGEKSVNGKRHVMAHKGIGKLAGFGIANIVEIRSVNNGWLTHFRMEYDKIEQCEFAGEYCPQIIADKKTTEKNGTTVFLREIKLSRAISEDQFKRSMLRRFAIFSDKFKVVINGKELKKYQMDLQFRFPPDKNKVYKTDIPNAGTIKWWMGFTEKPIDDPTLKGISVIARGKQAQEPWFFDLSGGYWGQHGQAYMTGEIWADFLDSKNDLIATDRATVLWDHPTAKPLFEWGQKTIKEHLKKWAEERSKKNIEKIKVQPYYKEMISKFQPSEQRELNTTIGKLAQVQTITEDRLNEIVQSLLFAYQNEHVMGLIKQVNAKSPDAFEEIWFILNEYNILEAVQTAQKVHARIDIIKKFRDMIKAGVPEKPDMQDFLMENSWLIKKDMEFMEHEKSLDNIIVDHFKIIKPKDKEGKKRLDFFCMTDSSRRAAVLELKRPGIKVSREELDRLRDYVFYLRTWDEKNTDPTCKYLDIRGWLIYTDTADDVTDEHIRSYLKDQIFVITWEKLLTQAEREHKDFLELIISHAPDDDPRIKALEK